jgi:NAD(P)-dependent dehydrogenase (short-subunit alcohol dehydrogenase family)
MAEVDRFRPTLLAQLERVTPLRRRGTPEEVATAILFLASEHRIAHHRPMLTACGTA